MPMIPVRLAITVTTGPQVLTRTREHVTNVIRHAVRNVDRDPRITFDGSDLQDIPTRLPDAATRRGSDAA